jgi:hypothetical protein
MILGGFAGTAFTSPLVFRPFLAFWWLSRLTWDTKSRSLFLWWGHKILPLVLLRRFLSLISQRVVDRLLPPLNTLFKLISGTVPTSFGQWREEPFQLSFLKTISLLSWCFPAMLI